VDVDIMLQVSGDGFITLATPIAIRAGQSLVRDWALTSTIANTRITGMVMDLATELPIPGAEVLLQGDSFTFTTRAMTDNEGRYTIASAPSRQTVTLTASADGYSPQRMEQRLALPEEIVEFGLLPFAEPGCYSAGT